MFRNTLRVARQSQRTSVNHCRMQKFSLQKTFSVHRPLLWFPLYSKLIARHSRKAQHTSLQIVRVEYEKQGTLITGKMNYFRWMGCPVAKPACTCGPQAERQHNSPPHSPHPSNCTKSTATTNTSPSSLINGSTWYGSCFSTFFPH